MPTYGRQTLNHPDLHTHTNLSDGALSPAELVQRAVSLGVKHLSITDHDTVAAYAGLANLDLKGVTITPGIELSTRWMKTGIHVVGLNIDPHHSTLIRGIEQQQAARFERAHRIASRLQKCGIPDPLPTVKSYAGDASIGRPHFARYLVDHGHCKNFAAAFKKFLGDGKAGDVRHVWPELDEVTAWINEAGGTAVLAHPARYGLTATKLRELVRDFVASGGESIEVVSGSQQPDVTKKLATLANEQGLSASCGSDFHNPVHRWSDLGKFQALPANVVPVWEQWKTNRQFA